MPKHSEQRVLPYTPIQMFDLVADIEQYPDFLPWCAAARITKRNEDMLVADLVIRFKAFQEKYTSKVLLQKPEGDKPGSINVAMIQGPFSHLVNDWKFTPHPQGCMVDFMIDFRFKSPLLEKMIGLMFDKAFNRMTEAFGERAHALYGK